MQPLEVKNGQVKGFKTFLTKKVIEYLKQTPEKRLGAREIAVYISEKYPEVKERVLETSDVVSDDTTFLNRLVARISQFKDDMNDIRYTEERPRKFYFTTKTDEDEVSSIEDMPINTSISQKFCLKESKLYPLLSSFLWSEHKVYSKRIDEKRSANRNGPNGNMWLYPDLVGVEDLTKEWEKEIKDCVQQYSDKKTKLWSFEVKPILNRSNVRQSFFQAVSNSSWANFAYLVASEINGSDGTMKELLLLSSLHGVGIITLNTENPSDSSILIPAKERPEVDWNNANRLAKENTDFLGYIKLIKQFYQIGEMRKADWDISTDQY